MLLFRVKQTKKSMRNRNQVPTISERFLRQLFFFWNRGKKTACGILFTLASNFIMRHEAGSCRCCCFERNPKRDILLHTLKKRASVEMRLLPLLFLPATMHIQVLERERSKKLFLLLSSLLVRLLQITWLCEKLF